MCLSRFAFIFFMVLFAGTANAETYQRGRGILLPDKTINSPNVFPLNNNNGATVIQRGKIIQQSPVVPNSIVRPGAVKNPNSGDQKMTNAYAAHLYTGVCSQEYRERIAPINEPNLNNQKMWADIQNSCKCMSQELLTVIPATDLADYVMYNYGADTPGSKNTEKSAYIQTGQSDKIGTLVANAALYKKCGFLK